MVVVEDKNFIILQGTELVSNSRTWCVINE